MSFISHINSLVKAITHYDHERTDRSADHGPASSAPATATCVLTLPRSSGDGSKIINTLVAVVHDLDKYKTSWLSNHSLESNESAAFFKAAHFLNLLLQIQFFSDQATIAEAVNLTLAVSTYRSTGTISDDMRTSASKAIDHLISSGIDVIKSSFKNWRPWVLFMSVGVYTERLDEVLQYLNRTFNYPIVLTHFHNQVTVLKEGFKPANTHSLFLAFEFLMFFLTLSSHDQQVCEALFFLFFTQKKYVFVSMRICI